MGPIVEMDIVMAYSSLAKYTKSRLLIPLLMAENFLALVHMDSPHLELKPWKNTTAYRYHEIHINTG